MRNPFVYLADYWTVLSLAVGGLVHRDTERFLTGTRSPVVVIPGVYESWAFMRPVAERLHESGHPVHVLPQLGRNVRSIAETAVDVQRYIDDKALSDVVIVAHSKGGLIAKHMMLINDTDSRILSLVTLATPFAGSRMARFMPIASLRIFSPSEATLVALAANAFANSRITSIYGSWDAHIPEGSVLDGATNIEVAVPGHFRLLANTDVIDLVARSVRS
jgi:triacylglycerol lipase